MWDGCLRVVFSLILLALVPFVFYFTTEGTWDLLRKRPGAAYASEFFLAQAKSMRWGGRFDVAPDVIRGECWWAGNRCYGYFGVTPSVVRMPFLPLLVRRWHSAATPLFLGFAVLVGCFGALRLLRRALARASPSGERSDRLVVVYGVVAALALVPGTLLFLTRPAVYEEACAWGVAFLLLAFDRVWAWFDSRRPAPLVAAVVFAIAAANARPTAAPSCAVLGLTVCVIAWAGGRPGRIRLLIAGVCLAALPALTAASVYWMKFGTPLPDLRLNEEVPEWSHWAKILNTNGDRTSGLFFTPTEVVAYFRPDAVTWSRKWPFFDFRFRAESIRWVPPLPRNGAYVEPVTSATTAMPLPWALTVVALFALSLQARGILATPQAFRSGTSILKRESWILAAGSLAGALAMIVLTITTVGITNRYLSDFYPASVVGTALASGAVVPVLRRHPSVAAALTLAGLALIVWSLLVVFSLTTRTVLM